MRKNSSQLIIEVENREVEFVQNDYKIVGSIGECLPKIFSRVFVVYDDRKNHSLLPENEV